MQKLDCDHGRVSVVSLVRCSKETGWQAAWSSMRISSEMGMSEGSIGRKVCVVSLFNCWLIEVSGAAVRGNICRSRLKSENMRICILHHTCERLDTAVPVEIGSVALNLVSPSFTSSSLLQPLSVLSLHKVT